MNKKNDSVRALWSSKEKEPRFIAGDYIYEEDRHRKGARALQQIWSNEKCNLLSVAQWIQVNSLKS